ncbi:heat shock 70 kDa protein 12A-like [Saccostrea echinata]|uniref:heat shock 70 kDa protein 12A-like n=1 Tax=Saccostrea echinata TaxID=191078 RepID=UPI002A8337A3|nr:heat shock 70 kDa protein 12A-like [Saccostrea echinata]
MSGSEKKQNPYPVPPPKPPRTFVSKPRTGVLQPNQEDKESENYDAVWPSKSNEELLKKIENLGVKDVIKSNRGETGHATGGQVKRKKSGGSVKDKIQQLEQKICDKKVRTIQTQAQERDMSTPTMTHTPVKGEVNRRPPIPKPRLNKRKSNEEQRIEQELKDEVYAEISDEEINKKSEYRYVAAIDIGTTYSGYAFSSREQFNSNPLDIFTPRWNDGLFLSLKTSTCALYNEKGEFDCFGYDADNKYYDMTLNDPDLVERCLKFTNFKMKLYDTKGSLEGLVLKADQGGTMPALIVFSDVILHLKNKIINDICQIKSDVIEDDVLWVLTVPAIWNDEARKFMIRASAKAGIHADDLVLCLEPEAAAVMCKELKVQNYIQTKSDSVLAFMLGTKFVVVDLGGGTVDITTNEVLPSGMIRELKCCRGSDCGGTYVDKCFWDFIRNVLDCNFETLSKSYRTEMHDLWRSFEIKKRQVDSQKSQYVMLQIPSIIASKMKSEKLSKYNVSLVRDKLKFPITLFQEFFSSSVSSILKCLREVVTDEIHSILLVGGYAGCKEIRQVIKQTYPSLRLVCPPESDLAVVKGAVIFGHNPAVISSRISKMWYGIQLTPEISPINKIYEGNFYSVTKKGQPIKIGEKVLHKFYIREKLKGGVLNLRQVSSSNDKMPVNVEEEINCLFSELRVPIPAHQDHMKRILNISIKFKGTEFVYSAFVTLKTCSPSRCVVKVT